MPTAHFPLLRDPQGSCQHRGRCPHPRSPRGRVQGKTSCTLTTNVGSSPPTCKGQPLRGCFASLDRFPAPSASVGLLPPRRWRGVKGDEVVHFTLDALESTTLTVRGRWIGFATCPCGLASEWGLGQSPKGGLFFVFEVVRVDVTVQKGQKNVHFRIFATKNTANLANF